MKSKIKTFLKKFLSPRQIAVLQGDKEFFSIVEIEINTECNRKCPYCPNSVYDRGDKKNKKFMKKELFESIIDQLSKINFNGKLHPHLYGEPLLDFRLIELLTYAQKKLPLAKIEIFSNGDFLTLELYKILEGLKIDRIKITNHSNKTQKNIEEIINYRNANNCSITFDYISLNTFYNRGGLTEPAHKKKITYCLLPTRYLTIDYDGNVILCCNDYFSSVKFGNLNKQSLTEICNDRYYAKTRKDIRKGVFKHGICKNCETYTQ